MNEALELIKDSTFKDADIMFITDGDCNVSDSFLKKFNRIREEKEFKTMGVLVNIGSSHVSDATLSQFCDSVVLVSNIADLTDGESNVNKNIFGAL